MARRANFGVTAAWLLLFTGGVLLPAVGAVAAAPAQGRAARDILKEYDAVAYPSMSDGSDPAALARFKQQIEAAAAKQEALALELYESHPGHARVAELMTRRWTLICTVSADGKRVLEETARHVDDEKTPLPLRKAAASTRALAGLTADLPFAERRRLVEEGLAVAPQDERAGYCLEELAKYHTADPEVQRELVDRFAKDFGAAAWAAENVKRLQHLVGLIGSELEVELAGAKDLAKGAEGPPLPATTRKLLGRPLLLHFGGQPEFAGFEQDVKQVAALRERFGPRGLEVVAVREEPEHFDDGPLAQLFHCRETGLSVLFDREGRVAAFCFKFAPLEPEIEKLVGGKRRRPA